MKKMVLKQVTVASALLLASIGSTTQADQLTPSSAPVAKTSETCPTADHIASAQTNVDQASADLDASTKTLQATGEQLNQLHQTLSVGAELLVNLRAEEEDLNTLAQSGTSQDLISKLSDELSANQIEQSQLTSEHIKLENELTAKTTTISEQTSLLTQLDTQKTEVEQAVVAARSEVSALESESTRPQEDHTKRLVELRSQLAQAQADLKPIQEELARQEAQTNPELARLKAEIDRLTAEIKVLEDKRDELRALNANSSTNLKTLLDAVRTASEAERRSRESRTYAGGLETETGNPLKLHDVYARRRSKAYALLEGARYRPDKESLIERINAIRQEAYQEGLIDRYVPIIWSNGWETIAAYRAAEAELTMDHVNLEGIEFSSAVSSENLAWNTDSSEQTFLQAIEQFYAEKEAYMSWKATGQKIGETSHYEALINPDNKYTGMASFRLAGQVPTRGQDWTTVSQLLSPVDNGVNSLVYGYFGEKVYQPIEVPLASLSNITLAENLPLTITDHVAYAPTITADFTYTTAATGTYSRSVRLFTRWKKRGDQSPLDQDYRVYAARPGVLAVETDTILPALQFNLDVTVVERPEVAQLKEAEAALEEHNQRFNAVNQQLHDILLKWNPLQLELIRIRKLYEELLAQEGIADKRDPELVKQRDNLAFKIQDLEYLIDRLSRQTGGATTNGDALQKAQENLTAKETALADLLLRLEQGRQLLENLSQEKTKLEELLTQNKARLTDVEQAREGLVKRLRQLANLDSERDRLKKAITNQEGLQLTVQADIDKLSAWFLLLQQDNQNLKDKYLKAKETYDRLVLANQACEASPSLLAERPTVQEQVFSQSRTLPKTGDSGAMLSLLGGLLLSVMPLVKRRYR